MVWFEGNYEAYEEDRKLGSPEGAILKTGAALEENVMDRAKAIQKISDEAGNTTAVIVPIGLWREPRRGVAGSRKRIGSGVSEQRRASRTRFGTRKLTQ